MYGRRRVWRASLVRLGYPATWITDGAELWDLEQALIQGIGS